MLLALVAIVFYSNLLLNTSTALQPQLQQYLLSRKIPATTSRLTAMSSSEREPTSTTVDDDDDDDKMIHDDDKNDILANKSSDDDVMSSSPPLPLPRGLHKRTRSRSFVGNGRPVRSVPDRYAPMAAAAAAASLSASSSVITTTSTSSKSKEEGRVERETKRHHHHHHRHHTRSAAHDSAMNVVVRPMTMSDIAHVYHLGNAIFTANDYPTLFRTWDDFIVVQNFENSPEFCFVAESKKRTTQNNKNGRDEPKPSGDELVGFLLGDSLTKKTCGTRGYIQWIAVHASYRRQGIGKSLLAAYLDVAQKHNISLLLADTPADNHEAIQMLAGVGLSHRMDHVYLTCRLKNKDRNKRTHVNDEGSFSFTYTANNQKITVRNMEVEDLHPIYLIGEKIFTHHHANLYHFWDEHLVMSSYLSDPDFCVVATVKEGGGGGGGRGDGGGGGGAAAAATERVVGFAFGTTIEKPRSSWKYGYLVWMGCDAAYQGLGLATQLYNVMLELFTLEKVRMIMVDTQISNHGALAFFRKKGFGQDEEHVYLSNAQQE